MKRILLTLSLALAAPLSAYAQVGILLAPDQVATLGKVKCGYVNGAWAAGTTVKKTGAFYSLSQQIVDTNKKLKNKKLSSSARTTLQLKLANLKSKLRQQRKICDKLTPPGSVVNPSSPVPAATPVSVPPTPAPDAVVTTWEKNATDISNNTGAEYLFFCPQAPAGGLRAIYGDYTYTTDSSICVAAVHAGLITRGLGGNVRFRIKGAQNLFFNAVRNGIESNSYSSYPTSYSFINPANGAEFTPPTAPPLTVSNNASSYYTYIGSTFTFLCPAGALSGGSVWGTDVYTYDSSICKAAIHAGKINNLSGGQVTILIVPGQSSYVGSTRNGVTTSNYGTWGGSYSFQ